MQATAENEKGRRPIFPLGDAAAYLSHTCFLYAPFLHPRSLPSLMGVCRSLREDAEPAWRRYQSWVAPYDAAVLRRSHALDEFAARLAKRRPLILMRRADLLQRLRHMNRLLRGGARCENRDCRVPIVRGTERCDRCGYWRCAACAAFRAPGTHALPCASCGHAALHGCRDCALQIPRDRERCSDCRRTILLQSQRRGSSA